MTMVGPPIDNQNHGSPRAAYDHTYPSLQNGLLISINVSYTQIALNYWSPVKVKLTGTHDVYFLSASRHRQPKKEVSLKVSKATRRPCYDFKMGQRSQKARMASTAGCATVNWSLSAWLSGFLRIHNILKDTE
ncbi:hypothetical protein FRB91_004940 [Serendipita sp. 411]|nr:hypothetical protein FRB91_004940 [Serendipita sp. 411]